MGRSAVAIPENSSSRSARSVNSPGCRRMCCAIGSRSLRCWRRKKNRAGQRVYRKRDVEIALQNQGTTLRRPVHHRGRQEAFGERSARRWKTQNRFVGRRRDSETNGSQAPSKEWRLAIRGTSEARTAEDRKSLRKVARELREILALLDTLLKSTEPKSAT